MLKHKQLWWAVVLVIVIGTVGSIVGLGLGKNKSHDFTGQCQLCHSSIPERGVSMQESHLVGNVQQMCSGCHTLNVRTSHPTDIRPKSVIPFQRFLDGSGKMTCITCHDVHKEDDPSFSQLELAGLLRGHTTGRAFCAICHDAKMLGSSWRHDLSVSYAHMSGKLIQKQGGGFLDKFSIECLSCHDGTITSGATAEVKEGNFTHGIGLSHPVGVKYPTDLGEKEFVSSRSLPEEVRLFNGTVGCLSCHNPYGKEKAFLAKNNSRSALCLTCHRK